MSRNLDRGTRQGERALRILADEFLGKRLELGISQQVPADATRISRPQMSRIEHANLRTLSVVVACRIGAVLGLDVSIRAYPGARPLRDTAHAERLRRILDHAAPPLRCRTEVPLPRSADHVEQRASDAAIEGWGKRTTFELEMRLHDGQALARRINLKRRDDPADGFLLLVADTRNNRRVLAENPGLFSELPRLRRHQVLGVLEAGRHPPSGLLLI